MEPAIAGHVDAARRGLRVHAWGQRRVEAEWQSFCLRLSRSRERHAAKAPTAWSLAGAAVVAGGAIALTLVLSRSPSAESPVASAVTASVAQPQRVELGTGAEAQVDPGARLDVVERSATRVVVALHAGSARFDVRHDPRRLIRVHAGAVAVEDLGTKFEVEHRGLTARVSVTEGSVSVSFPESEGEGRSKVTLDAGKSAIFPAVAAFERAPANEQTTEIPQATPPTADDARRAASPAPASGWRELARTGKHGGAYELLAPRAFRDVGDDPSDLLLASDAARLSHHPAEAVQLLRRLLARHGRDPRAPSAAFTLGWLLLNELNRPREAASAFARAEALAPRGNLAEDAIARAVEAWYRAGDLTRASAEVERYRKGYPNGRHLAMLERLVGAP
jgi:transmembrane sensor